MSYSTEAVYNQTQYIRANIKDNLHQKNQPSILNNSRGSYVYNVRTVWRKFLIIEQIRYNNEKFSKQHMMKKYFGHDIIHDFFIDMSNLVIHLHDAISITEKISSLYDFALLPNTHIWCSRKLRNFFKCLNLYFNMYQNTKMDIYFKLKVLLCLLCC